MTPHATTHGQDQHGAAHAHVTDDSRGQAKDDRKGQLTTTPTTPDQPQHGFSGRMAVMTVGTALLVAAAGFGVLRAGERGDRQLTAVTAEQRVAAAANGDTTTISDQAMWSRGAPGGAVTRDDRLITVYIVGSEEGRQLLLEFLGERDSIRYMAGQGPSRYQVEVARTPDEVAHAWRWAVAGEAPVDNPTPAIQVIDLRPSLPD